MKKIPVGVIGATGLLGQTYLSLLAHHPWFEVVFLAASEKSAGKKYGEVVSWQCASPCPFSDFPLFKADDIEEAKKRCSLVFTALPGELAKTLEERFAEKGLRVISNASYARFLEDVPLIIPEVNPDHLDLIFEQRRRRGWKSGFIVAKPNCAVQAFMLPIAPLDKKFGLKSLHVTTLQAISGAGLHGLASHEIHDNIIPYIDNEEDKLEREPKKLLGKCNGRTIENKEEIAISAHCHRVPVLHGHFISLSCSFEKKPSLEEVLSTWKTFQPKETIELPSAPKPPLVYFDEKNRPQNRLDLMQGAGMAASLGRLSSSPLFDIHFSSLAHNAIRGGAGGGVLTAELLYSKGFLSNETK